MKDNIGQAMYLLTVKDATQEKWAALPDSEKAVYRRTTSKVAVDVAYLLAIEVRSLALAVVMDRQPMVRHMLTAIERAEQVFLGAVRHLTQPAGDMAQQLEGGATIFSHLAYELTNAQSVADQIARVIIDTLSNPQAQQQIQQQMESQSAKRVIV